MYFYDDTLNLITMKGVIVLKKLSKIIVLIFSSLMIFCLSACASENSANNNASQPAQQTSSAQDVPETNQQKAKVLVAYFSCTGNTENAAKQIASATGGDLYAILPAQPYTDADLRYNDDTTRATKEQHDASARPAIEGTVANFQQYDVIFVGYPIWWDQAPRVINTFMESYDFSGKKVVPFCTSGGSSITNSVNQLKSAYGNITWLEGKRLGSGVSQDEVNAWIDSLNIK